MDMSAAFDIEEFTRKREAEFERIADIVGDISLSSFRHYSRMSEETFCFSTNVRYKGKQIGTASNDGRGGMTNFYHKVDVKVDLYDRLKDSCTELRMDDIIDHLVDAEIERKETAKMERHFNKIAATAHSLGITVMWASIDNGRREEITSINTRDVAKVEKVIADMAQRGWHIIRKA